MEWLKIITVESLKTFPRTLTAAVSADEKHEHSSEQKLVITIEETFIILIIFSVLRIITSNLRYNRSYLHLKLSPSFTYSLLILHVHFFEMVLFFFAGQIN